MQQGNRAQMSHPTELIHRQDFLRLQTVILLRWLAVLGQSAAYFVAVSLFELDINSGLFSLCLGASIISNLIATRIYPRTKRLSSLENMSIFLFDVLQLGALLFLTGGLNNPFALFILGPVTVAAFVLDSRSLIFLSAVALGVVSMLYFVHIPLHFADGSVIEQPFLIKAATWMAITIAVMFLAFYTQRVSHELQSLAAGRLAAEMALAREQKLTDLGGLVAAAAHELNTPLATIKLTSSELMEELRDDPELYEDAKLIKEQTERCRDILKSMGTHSADHAHLHHLPISEVLHLAAAPHTDRDREVIIRAAQDKQDKDQPQIRNQPEVIHSVRNFIQNAVDHARKTVTIEYSWDDAQITLRIMDDGRGFNPDVLSKVGEPFLDNTPTAANKSYRGMGLGLFISLTLLERTGARIHFANRAYPKRGAIVSITWPRENLQDLT